MTFFTNRRQPESETGPEQNPPRSTFPTQPVGFETVLGASSDWEGRFTSSGNVRIDGRFAGTLNIDGNILVGETANIKADIHARNISIAGAVRGNVTGNKVQILRTGRVWGDIAANALTTEEGAFIDGKISMKSHAANQPAGLPSQAEAVDEPVAETLISGADVPEVVEGEVTEAELVVAESADESDAAANPEKTGD